MHIATLSPGDWLSALAGRDAELEEFRSHLRSIDNNYCQNRKRLMPNHLVVFVQQGQFKAELDDDVCIVKAGDVLWIPPGVTRLFSWKKGPLPTVDYRMHFSLTREDQHLSFCVSSERRSGAWHLRPLFQILTHAYNSPIEFQQHHLRGTLLGLCAGYLSLSQTEQASTRIFSEIQKLRLNEFIERHIADGISPYDLSAELALSHDYFTRIFRETYGLAPRYYLKQQRMRIAASRILESDISIAEVARQLGIRDANLFARQFRQVMNCSPREYRRTHAQTQLDHD